MRKIVQVRPHDDFAAAWIAGTAADQTRLKGILANHSTTAVAGFAPVPLFNRGFSAAALAADVRASSDRDGYLIAADVPDAAVATLLQEPDVVGVFADPMVMSTGANCDISTAFGTHSDVAVLSGAAALNLRGLRGTGVRVAVVDTGIDGTLTSPVSKPLQGSIETSGVVSGYKPGSSARGHGSMCAFDVLVTAPDVSLIDVPLLSSDGSLHTFTSDAAMIFGRLLDLFKASPDQPLVVTNSWALYDLSADEPVGSPQNYAFNPNHPLNRTVGEMVAAGIDVVFAAGNCGADCPISTCTAGSIGPGNSILGANSHPSVICVGATSIRDDRFGYSSQGPGALDPQKPDVLSFSGFVGSHVGDIDSGTSAACPIVAGIVADLRGTFKTHASQTIRSAMRMSARQLGPAPWNRDFGFGIVNGDAAYAILSAQTSTLPPHPTVGPAIPAAALHRPPRAV